MTNHEALEKILDLPARNGVGGLRHFVNNSWDSDTRMSFSRDQGLRGNKVYSSNWDSSLIRSFLIKRMDQLPELWGEYQAKYLSKEKENRTGKREKQDESLKDVAGNPDETGVYFSESDFPSYCNRDIDTEMKEACSHWDRQNILLEGDSGTGKTESAKYLSFQLSRPALVISMTIDNPIRDYLVRRELEDGCTRSYPAQLISLYQRPSVIVLDEINMLPAKSLSRLHEMLNSKVYVPELDTEIGRHPDCVIVATQNPKETKYSGTEALNKALISRFHMVFSVPVFEPKEISKITGCETVVAEYFHELSELFTRDKKQAVVDIRSVMNFVSQSEVFGLDKAISRLADKFGAMDQTTKEIVKAHAEHKLIADDDQEAENKEESIIDPITSKV